jgi:hypothetical protein
VEYEDSGQQKVTVAGAVSSGGARYNGRMGSPRIVICMTTFNPPERLFLRQVESLREQSYMHWTCLVQDDHSNDRSLAMIAKTLGDDARFRLERNESTLGFYRNFERVLSRVPVNAQLVSLCDQDDDWYRDKVARLVEAFDADDVTLAHCDLTVTGPRGEVLADHFIDHARHPLHLESHFFTNTIPGAVCMFRASLLPKILPFPASRGTAYYDWWIILVALAAGKVRFVKEVLQDYVQHGSNAVGWKHKPRPVSPARLMTSSNHRREMIESARKIRDEDCAYLADAVLTLCERVPDSRHLPAMKRLQGLLTHPRRTMLMQYLRAVRSGRGSRRQRNLLLAQVLGRAR